MIVFHQAQSLVFLELLIFTPLLKRPEEKVTEQLDQAVTIARWDGAPAPPIRRSTFLKVGIAQQELTRHRSDGQGRRGGPARAVRMT